MVQMRCTRYDLYSDKYIDIYVCMRVYEPVCEL